MLVFNKHSVDCFHSYPMHVRYRVQTLSDVHPCSGL